MALSSEVREFLSAVRFAVLATINTDGLPQQTVVWYELQGDEIMMNTAAGRLKERNLRRDPRVSICIEDNGRFVTLRGRAHMNDDRTTAQADILRLAIRYDGAEQAQREAEAFRLEHRITIRVPIESVHAELD
jgi:PPOX class probable F420-dependent enzyme